MTDRTIAIVGASLAGFRAAEELRAEGFDGRLVVVGDEPHRPYDRPPLSKDVLGGKREPRDIELSVAEPDLDLDIDWELGVRAVELDVGRRRLVLADGRHVGFDGCVLATGATPRRIPGWPESRPGLHVLRTLDDCLALRADLDASPGRVAVVGAGFIGAEVAATARGRGLEVTVVEPLAAPVVRAVGPRIGGFLADLHRDNGVDVRLGIGVDSLVGDDHVTGVRLSDGSSVAADVVVVGIGVRPATAWLEGSGLVLDDGVVCDETCLAAPGVVAAGDVARWPVDGADQPTARIEHWDNAVAQGAHAACTLLADLAGGRGEPFAPVPWFWSDQYDRKLQLAGRASADCDVEIVAGSMEERRFTALYGRAGRLVAVLGINMPAKIVQWRNRLAAGVTPFEDAVAEARA